MGMHYIIQGIFVVVGLLAILASLFNWDWFFQSQNSQFIVHNVGRKRARLFYALLGLLMIATAVYFFLEVQEAIQT
ncbi:MAG: immunity 17 family protein [Bacteroides sp.]|nr:immunity 17 family protein [Bacteroides sp.]MBQ8875871.1 immunity 17 family protein [Bacteroides sp.]